jgi:hypothetical protein
MYRLIFFEKMGVLLEMDAENYTEYIRKFLTWSFMADGYE